MYIVREVDPLSTGNKEVIDIKNAILEKEWFSWDELFDKINIDKEEITKSQTISTNAEESKV